MKENKLPITNETKVIVTDENGKSREGSVINQDNGYYLINFPGILGNEFWSPGFVQKK